MVILDLIRARGAYAGLFAVLLFTAGMRSLPAPDVVPVDPASPHTAY